MDVKLTKKGIKNPTILCGFQGTWVVGPITVQYLLDHMKFEEVGEVWFPELMPFSLIHKGELIKPLSVFYNKKHNLLVLRATTPVRGIEWQIAAVLESLAKQTKAKEVLVLDGVETNQMNDVFFLSNTKGNAKLRKAGAVPLDNAALMGVHSALLIKDNTPVTCLYGTLKHTAKEPKGAALLHIGDGRTAARVVEFLDAYLGMKVKVKDLIDKSNAIELKIKNLMQQAAKQEQNGLPSQGANGTPSYIN